jgi:hypothetical protein
MKNSILLPQLRRFLPGLAALAFAVALAATPAHAQRPTGVAGPTLVGTVVESGTGKPLAYAMVAVTSGGLPTLTDSTGVFRITGLPVGVHNVTASQLGYSRLTLPVVVGEGMEPVVFQLFPDPIALEGIKVMGDRFRGRRNALAVSSQGYSADRLRQTPALSVMDFLATDGKLSPAICPGRSNQQFLGCFNRRGQVIEPQVFLDEAPLMGGMSQLEGYNPSDFYLIEVIGNGLMIRAYTHGYIDQTSKNPRALEPIIIR